MPRYDIRTLGYASCLALALAACGKKDSASTDRSAEATGSVASSDAVRVSDVKVGRAIGADKRITDETDEFKPTDVIYAVVETKGAATAATLQARWTYEDGQVVDQSSQAISPGAEGATEFHVSKPGGWPKGKYKVEITLNGAPAESEGFEVK